MTSISTGEIPAESGSSLVFEAALSVPPAIVLLSRSSESPFQGLFVTIRKITQEQLHDW